MSTLLEKIKEEAVKNKLTLNQLNERAGLGTNAIYRWKDQTPSIEKLQKVADVLHVSTDYLLGRSDRTASNNKLDLKDALDDEIILAFDGHDIPDEDKAKIKEYIQLLDLKRRSEHE